MAEDTSKHKLNFVFAPDLRSFADAVGSEAVTVAWHETGVQPPLPRVLNPEGSRAERVPLAYTVGCPVVGTSRPVEVRLVRNAFAAYEGLVFTLARPRVLAAAKCALELLHMLEDVCPSDFCLRLGATRPSTVRIALRALAFARVLQGAASDPRSFNPFYDEVRFFGNAKPSGSDVVHVARLAPVLRSFSCNFLHFLAGALPVAVALLRHVPPDALFLVYGTAFARGLLRRAGVPEERLLIYDPHCVYYAEELYLVLGLNEAGDLPAPETVQVIREALARPCRALGPGLGVPAPRLMLLVQRRGSERRLENADEVGEAMRAVASCRGVQVVSVLLEALSIEKQLLLVEHCCFLLGTEGAGLAHAAHLEDSATVVNVLPTRSRFGPLPSQHGYGYFHHLCAARGTLRYRAIAVPEADWDTPAVRAPMRAVCTVLEEWSELRS